MTTPSADVVNDALAAAARLGIDFANLPDHLLPLAPPASGSPEEGPANSPSPPPASSIETRKSSEQVTPKIPRKIPSAADDSESGEVSSGISKIPKKKCRGLNKVGRPCGAYRLKDGELCLFHEADAVTHLSEAQSNGGQANRARKPSLDVDDLALAVNNRLELQAITETVLRMQFAGSIPGNQLSRILRTLAILERNLAGTSLHTLADDRRYATALNIGIEASLKIAEGIEEGDHAEHTRRIETVAAARAEYLKANQKYGHLTARRGPTPSSPAFPNFRLRL